MALIDTHAHLTMENFSKDLNDVIIRSSKADVELIIDIAIDIASSKKVIKNCKKYDTVFGAAGIHPHEASKTNKNCFTELSSILDFPKIIAVGEIGLDYYYNYSPKKIQKKYFIQQMQIAVNKNLPVIIHMRDAMSDGLEIIENLDKIPKGVFHCFSGSKKNLMKIIEMGFHVSFTGMITFKNFQDKNIVTEVPLEKLLLETDSPFMTPVPFRGKRNDPAYLRYIVPVLSQLFDISENSMAEITTSNAYNLFNFGNKNAYCS